MYFTEWLDQAAKNLLVAALFFLLGSISLKLSIPPGYATIIFPPAGLALVAALRGGHKLLPGVFLGSLSLNLLINSEPTDTNTLIAVLIATGATLQAWLGAYALKKYTQIDWQSLNTKMDVFWFYLVGGPISCLVSASLGCLSLYFLSDIPIDTIPKSWLFWWVGDSIGVIMAAPILLAIVFRKEEIWHNRLSQSLLPTVIAITISIAIFGSTLQNENRQLSESINKVGNSILNKINIKVKTYDEIIASIARMKSTYPETSYKEFTQYSAPVLDVNKELQALSWNPFVLASERDAFEKKLSLELNRPNLKIMHRAESNELSASPENSFYMPIGYIYPAQGNEKAIGFDIASNAIRLDAIEKAISTGKPAMTAPISLVQEAGTSAGVLIIHPLFRKNSTILEGAAVGVVRMQNIMSGILQAYIEQGLKIAIDDKNSADGYKTLYQDGPKNTSYSIDHLWQGEVDLGSRTWQVRVYPSANYISQNQSFTPWQVLFVGILLSIALQTFLLIFTGRHHAFYERLKMSASVFKNAHEGIMITDTNGTIVDVNPKFSDITGYSKSEIVGINASILSSNHHSEEFYTNMWSKLQSPGYWQDEIWNKRKNGDIFAEFLTISSIADFKGNRSYYVGLFSDITTSKEQQKSLELMAHYDPLTGLPNRVLFADRAKQAVAHSKRTNTLLAVCFLDIDRFKQINDMHGHHTGDLLLTEVANRIQLSIRDENTVSRIGGDEFSILLGDLSSKDDCAKTVNRILMSLADPFVFDNVTLNITGSCGITVYPSDNADLDTLVRHADQAMYKAKLAGRNQYQFFDLSHDTNATQKYLRLQEILEALTLKQFVLFYQPKVNMKTGDVFGLEALIRWNHPSKGMISPMEFLPLLDGTDLELEVGDWVINEALLQMQEWTTAGLSMEVSVNISPHHLHSSTFVESLGKILKKYPAVRPGNLQLEILESSAFGDLQKVNHILQVCREKLGVQIALDDFGTGYSSLTHLRNLTSQTIKIDQSFVRDILDDANDFSIVDGIIGLTKSFSLDVIAEGVETTEHGLMLLSMGCTLAQGYHIARPMPATQFAQWLEHYSPVEAWTHFASVKLSAKNSLLLQAHLVMGHWYSQFERAMASPESAPSIAKNAQKQQAVFMAKALKEKLFERSEFELLESAHNNLHQKTDIALATYHEHSKEESAQALKEAKESYRQFLDLLKELGLSFQPLP